MRRDGESKEIGDHDRFEHMLRAAEDAVAYARGRKRADLDNDSMLLRALVQCVDVIGEAAARTSDAGRARAAALPWPKIVGMRHILVHAYYRIDPDAVWRVVVEDLPDLITSVQEVLSNWTAQDADAESTD
jgi:uncharacterized protein with HEPN domain